jgi:hypothetical protein
MDEMNNDFAQLVSEYARKGFGKVKSAGKRLVELTSIDKLLEGLAKLRARKRMLGEETPPPANRWEPNWASIIGRPGDAMRGE